MLTRNMDGSSAPGLHEPSSVPSISAIPCRCRWFLSASCLPLCGNHGGDGVPIRADWLWPSAPGRRYPTLSSDVRGRLKPASSSRACSRRCPLACQYCSVVIRGSSCYVCRLPTSNLLGQLVRVRCPIMVRVRVAKSPRHQSRCRRVDCLFPLRCCSCSSISWHSRQLSASDPSGMVSFSLPQSQVPLQDLQGAVELPVAIGVGGAVVGFDLVIHGGEPREGCLASSMFYVAVAAGHPFPYSVLTN